MNTASKALVLLAAGLLFQMASLAADRAVPTLIDVAQASDVAVTESTVFEDLQRAPTMEKLRSYLARYPTGLYREAVRRMMEELADDAAWERAATDDTANAYEDYLALFPAGKMADEAIRRISGETEEEDVEPPPVVAERDDAPVGGFTLSVGKHMQGTLIAALLTPRIDGCEAVCASRDECVAFVFDQRGGGRCNLLSETATPQDNPNTTLGVRSGSEIEVAAGPLFRVAEGKQMRGDIADAILSGTQDVCQARCVPEGGCIGYVFDRRGGGRCTLLSGPGPLQDNPNMTTGVIER